MERGRLPAAGSARGSGHARAFRRASQMRQGPDRGDRPSGPGHGKDHAESRTVRQRTASGTRQDRTGDRPARRVRDIETQTLSYIGLRQTERAGTQRTTIVLHGSPRWAIYRQPRAPTGSATLTRGRMAQTV